LLCQHCGHEHEIPHAIEDVQELDFLGALAAGGSHLAQEQTQIVPCQVCGAELSFNAVVESDLCAFCGSAIVIKSVTIDRIRPHALLPFKITRTQAIDAFKLWIKGLWFAPSSLKALAKDKASQLSGIYVPYWTFDSQTTTWYSGERGDDYWEEESYTTTENGKSVTRTRKVRRTRWHPVSGTVFDSFDDVLVVASNSLPSAQSQALEPWDLENLQNYDEQFLSGFRTERYHVDLEQGFSHAKQRMEGVIQSTIRRDIGGDHQRIHQQKTQYDAITFKHVLLPIWVSTYRYGDKPFRYLVSGRSGKVQGERPYSWPKIAAAVLAAAAIIAGVVVAVQYLQ
jgi:hypothetical protein